MILPVSALPQSAKHWPAPVYSAKSNIPMAGPRNTDVAMIFTPRTQHAPRYRALT
jgi:hypothetical protein